MTRDQLFALPVGTRLEPSYDKDDYTAEIAANFDGEKHLVLRVPRDSSLVRFLMAELQVIPGELDASEGVE